MNGCENASNDNKKPAVATELNFENAVNLLNTLPKPTPFLNTKDVIKTQKYLLRADITLDSLDTLSVIHVAGTKGKGSTCAMCESILRHHGYRTGFYSSPHLVDIRERIRINGAPISKEDFTTQFYQIYNTLNDKKDYEDDMPRMFMFLTILAYKIFLIERVDVAIIEVGIGGQYCATNVLRKVPVVGITSLGIDHTHLLGKTIEEIAWHKAGIMKPSSHAFTSPQPESALKVFRARSIERNCSSFEVVEPIRNLSIVNKYYPTEIFNFNSNLAVALCQAWINYRNKVQNTPDIVDILTFEVTTLGLSKFNWPGRYQIIENGSNRWSTYSRKYKNLRQMV